jgi:gliding motility-associated-like protein
MRKFYQKPKLFFCAYKIIVIIFFIFSGCTALAQCPPNIDFEQGNFNGWQCWTGSHLLTPRGTDYIRFDTSLSTNPIANRHTIFTSNPGAGIDPFGGFAVNCPNGSGHSIKLGNNIGGHQAEGVSYIFTIPSNQNKFNLIYNYAVVLQDGGSETHSPAQQPHFYISIVNITDGITVDCSSFSFIAASNLPGFSTSLKDTTVKYKDWSAVSVNLNGNAGKKIQVFFTSADCVFEEHFCYAYIDIDTDCNSYMKSIAYCKSDAAVNIKAPVGFKNYTWYSGNFAQVLGSQQTLIVSPLPPSDSLISVEVIPKDGYGCRDTFTNKLVNLLAITASAGPDLSICNSIPAQLGNIPIQGLVYKWSPADGLDNVDVSNPFASPVVPTQYLFTAKSDGGSCEITDTVQVNIKNINNNVNLNGNTNYCTGTGLFPILKVNVSDSIQWFKNDTAINGASKTAYTVTQSGRYYAQIFNNTCPLPVNTKETLITINSPLPGTSYPVVDVAYFFPLKLHARQIGKSFLWSPATNLDNIYIAEPVFKGINQQLYLIKIKDSLGCITVDTQLVKTHKAIEIYVPTAFTPNSDNKNDYLKPVLVGIEKVNYFRIYDRWGKLLFEMKNNDSPGWDGKVNNILQEIQTVLWVIEAVDVDGKVHNEQGTTVLYR